MSEYSTANGNAAEALSYNRRFYEQHYSNPLLRLRYDLVYRAKRTRHLLRRHGIPSGMRQMSVFEYGFGAGHLLRAISGESRVVAMEYSHSAVTEAKRARPDWSVLRGDNASMLPFRSGSFDLVCCCHVLEHLPEDEGPLREFYRILRGGGALLILLPANESLFPGSKHLRLYPRNEFVLRLKALGLEEVCVDEHQRFDRPWKSPRVILASRRNILLRAAIEVSKNALFLPPVLIHWRVLGALDSILSRVSAPSTSIAYLFRKP